MKKVIVIGVIALFIGVGVQPAFAVEPIISTDIAKEEDIEPKDYLFETIIEIANNPEVKELLEECGYNNIYNFYYGYNGIYRQILFNNPKLLFSMLFTKPKMTNEYLNFVYNQGCDIVNIIGEDKTLEMIKSVEISNPEFSDELNNIIMNNEELSSRISTLEIMNNEVKPDKPFWEHPIICAISWIMVEILVFITLIISYLEYIYNDYPILSSILTSFAVLFAELGIFFLILIEYYDCFFYNINNYECHEEIEQVVSGIWR